MTFADYDLAATHYDAGRFPVGLDFVLSALSRGATPLANQILLDAGCGTGNYTAALIRSARAVHGLEFNRCMLKRARAKVGATAGIALSLGTVLKLPYQDAAFDGVTCNFVLHHLDPDQGRFRELSSALDELGRVLKPGGVVSIQSASHEQIRDGYWWAALIPAAVERAQARYISLLDLSAALEERGFEQPDRRILIDEVLQGEGYLDPTGPLKDSFRSADSTWAMATKDELARAEERTRDLIETGQMDSFLGEREALRRGCGQATFVSARKA